MSTSRILLLLRHAKAADIAPGKPDEDRALTTRGLKQSRQVGDYLRQLDVTVDHALCSTATRTRQTLNALSLGCPAEFSQDLYNAAADTILEHVWLLADEIETALMVGHAPGVPALTHDLIDEEASEPTALATIADRFPTATLVRLDFDGDWSDLQVARLVDARLAS